MAKNGQEMAASATFVNYTNAAFVKYSKHAWKLLTNCKLPGHLSLPTGRLQ